MPYSLQQDFLDSMDRLEKEKVDIFLGNHVWNNKTHGKYEKLKAGDKYAFVNQTDWAKCMRDCKQVLTDIISKENK